MNGQPQRKGGAGQQALTLRRPAPKVGGNTPAMPLFEAHSGGFFVPGGCL